MELYTPVVGKISKLQNRVSASQFDSAMEKVKGRFKEVKARHDEFRREDDKLAGRFEDVLGRTTVVLLTSVGAINAGFYLMTSSRTLTCETVYAVLAVTIFEVVGSFLTFLTAKWKIEVLRERVHCLMGKKRTVDAELGRLILFADHNLPEVQSMDTTVDIHRLNVEIRQLSGDVNVKVACERPSRLYLIFVGCRAAAACAVAGLTSYAQFMLFCRGKY